MRKRFLIYIFIIVSSVLAINSILLFAIFKNVLLELNITSANVIIDKTAKMAVIIGILLIFYSILFAISIMDKIFSPYYEKDIDPEKIRSKSLKSLLPIEIQILEQHDRQKMQKEAYKREKKQLELVMQNMSEGLIIISLDQNILYANPNAQKLLKSTKDDYKNKNFLSLSRDKHFVQAVKLALLGHKYSKIVDIKKRKIQIFSSPVYYKNEMIAVFCLISDKTEEHERNKHKTQFTANVSHELKTPLTSILGYSDLISEGIAKNEDVKIFADKIKDQSHILLSMINDIIKLSKIEDASQIEKEDVDFSELIKYTINNLKIQCKEKNIELIEKIHDDIHIVADHKMMEDLANNLISNAIKYNILNGKIFITLTQNSNETIFSVEDTGIGIAEDKQDRVFERFYTIDKSHSKKNSGTGLGLSIVKHIAMGHDARIILESEENIGSKFTVIFKNDLDEDK